MTIGIVSLITYGLVVWPFTTFPEYRISGLFQIALFGALPATVFGIVASRRFELAGASGFFGGSMAAAVFMFLRLQQTLLGKYTKDLPTPEYPDSIGLIIPIAWFVWAAMIAFVSCRRQSLNQ